MKVLLFGAADERPGFPRLRGLTASLEFLGAKVDRLLLPPPPRDRSALFRNPWKGFRFLSRVLLGRKTLLERGRRLPRPDLVLAGYPAFGTADLAKRIWPGVPVAVDFFLSLYDTVILDRGLWPDRGLGARFLRRLDRATCAAGDVVLTDTVEMGDFCAETTGLPRERFVSIPCGDPDAPEVVDPYRPPGLGEALRVFFAGTGPPLQGVETILEALERCRAPVALTLAGGGRAALEASRAERSGKVRFLRSWLDRETLGREIRSSHLVLGIFGTTKKADRVVPLKVYHGLSEGRPVLTGDSRAVRRLLAPGKEILLSPRGDPAALAARIEELREDPALLEEVARRGRAAFESRFSLTALAGRWREILGRLGIEAPLNPGERPEGEVESPSLVEAER